MQKYILIKVTLLFMACCPCTAQQLPELGQEWKNAIADSSQIYVPSGFMPLSVITINDVEYTIGVDKSIHTVKYIGTRNSGFILNGSTVIGRSLSSFKNKNDVKLIRGWGHYLKLDKNWYAAFDWKELTDTSKVLFVFKYELNH